jgi:8-oxo-dGTP diphosphatase
VIFTLRGEDLAVLLIQRGADPFKGSWALPGGFVNENESLDRAAARELQEETGLSNSRLVQIGAFGDPGRDPRGHTVTIAWATYLVAEPKVTAADDAAAAEWHSLKDLALPGVTSKKKKPVKLAFDHAKILAQGFDRLCRHLDDPVRDRSFDLLPSRFTLAELQHIYAAILGKSESPRAFKKRLIDRGLVVPAASKPTRKPAEQLYRWNRR